MTRFKLRLPEKDLVRWAERYSYPSESEIEERIAPHARQRGHLTHEEFVRLCRWKTPRSQHRCAANAPGLVEEVTRAALSATHEELKIGALLVLDGVSWPTASVILHFCDHRPYPIVDYRALWSVGSAVPTPYTFPFWRAYTEFMRGVHQRTGLPMTVLDRALWQYSKEKQPASG